MLAFWVGLLWMSSHAEATLADFSSGEPKEAQVRLAGRAIVDGDVVVLGAVAMIEGGRARDREALNQITLAQIPGSMSTYRVPGAYIRQRIREAIGPDRNVTIEVPNFVEFSRKQKMVTTLDIRDFVAAAIRDRFNPPADVHITVSPESPIEPLGFDPETEVKFDLMSVPSQGSGRTTLKVSFMDKNSRKKRDLIVPMRVNWQAERWIAKRSLSNRLPITVADFERRTVALGARDVDAIEAIDETSLAAIVEGARLRRSLNEGMLLTKSILYRDPDVNRGQKLRVVIRSESGLEIQTSGEALLNGSVGGTLRVRLEKTGRILSGQLVAKDLVEMNL